MAAARSATGDFRGTRLHGLVHWGSASLTEGGDPGVTGDIARHNWNTTEARVAEAIFRAAPPVGTGEGARSNGLKSQGFAYSGTLRDPNCAAAAPAP